MALETSPRGPNGVCIAGIDIWSADAKQLLVDLEPGGLAMVRVVRSDAAQAITIEGP